MKNSNTALDSSRRDTYDRQMKCLGISLFCLVGSATALAQSIPACVRLHDYTTQAASLWYQSQPNQYLPFDGVEGCRLDSDRKKTTCVKKVSSVDEGKLLAVQWLQQTEKCLPGKQNATAIKTIQTPTAKHYVIQIPSMEYRGLSMTGSLRVQEDKDGTFVIFQSQAVPTARIQPEQQICTSLDSLLDDEQTDKNWEEWQGPLIEKWDGASNYTCAKVPYGLASRSDCKMEVHPNALRWTSRWVYPMAQAAEMEKMSDAMVTTMASCSLGAVVTRGQLRQRIDYPAKMTRVEIEASRNDAGRGPSITVQVIRWKN